MELTRLCHLAFLSFYRGQQKRAFHFLDSAWARAVAEKDQQLALDILLQKGLLYDLAGRKDEAASCYGQVVAEAEGRPEANQLMAEALINLALVEEQRGDPDRSLKLLSRANALLTYLDDGEALSRAILFNEGRALACLGRIDEARTQFELLLGLEQDDQRRAEALVQLALTIQDETPFEAERSFLEAADLFEELEDQWGMAAALTDAANCLRRAGDPGQALNHHRRAIALRTSAGLAGRWRDHFGFALACEDLDNLAGAVAALERALSEASSPKGLVEMIPTAVRVQLKAGDIEAACHWLDRGLELVDGKGQLGLVDDLFRLVGDLLEAHDGNVPYGGLAGEDLTLGVNRLLDRLERWTEQDPKEEASQGPGREAVRRFLAFLAC
jgi:tetratricopeptide (TPR) repeat protein